MSATSKQSLNLTEIFSVRSERLKELRIVVESIGGFKSLLGTTAAFSLVIDTNVVLGDILWLVVERKCPAAKTQLMETIDAGTLDVYVPPKLLEEVEEKIPLIAAEKGLNVELMYAEWKVYKTRLKIAYPDDEKVKLLQNGVDPDDADFVALAQTIMASGIFSKDKHIEMMGGNRVSIECVTHLRDYSRATSVEMNIKINGVVFSYVSIAVIKSLIEGSKILIKQVASAPGWVKVVMVMALAYIALNPRARETVANLINSTLSLLRNETPRVLLFIAETSKMASVNEAKAKSHLEKAMIELEGIEMPASG